MKVGAGRDSAERRARVAGVDGVAGCAGIDRGAGLPIRHAQGRLPEYAGMTGSGVVGRGG